MLLLDGLDLIEHPAIFVFVFAFALASPAYVTIGAMIFDDWQDFIDCLKACYAPIWPTFTRGEAGDLHVRILSVGLFALLSVIAVCAVYKALLVAAGMLHLGP